MADANHEHKQRLVFDRVEDAIVANTNTEDGAVALQCVSASGTWISGQTVDGVRNFAESRLVLDLLQVALGGGLELDGIGRFHHRRLCSARARGLSLIHISEPTRQAEISYA